MEVVVEQRRPEALKMDDHGEQSDHKEAETTTVQKRVKHQNESSR